MVQLTRKEHETLRSQIATIEKGKGKHRKYRPFVFTEHGILMLSSVLNSSRAIEVNIQIMRAFVQLRRHAFSIIELKKKVNQMESKYDKQFKVIFDALRKLLEPPARKINRGMGFTAKK